MFGRAALAIIGRGQLLYRPRYFSSHITADWPEGIKKFLEREKIDRPTLIQEKTLPIVMKNKDLVGVARTGSGKTLAFVIPAVMKVLNSRDDAQTGSTRYESRPPTCLVLAPTRELASQTGEVIDKFRNLGLNSISLVGGASRGEQVRQLYRKNHDIYVATPGRLMDLIDTKEVDLSHIKYLVLDEADRMLDMGFEPQIRRILESVPKDRQTVMWSATWPREIQALASEFMKEFEYVAVDSEKLKANPNIKQIIEVCQPQNKLKLLLNHLNRFKEECAEPRTLIFVNTKRLAEQLLIHLMRNRVRAISIHGDRSQRQRDDAMRLFKNRLCHTLVATDVAARGLDISDITHVVNFDFPNTIEDYIHRIGRTARHDRKGVAITMFTENNMNNAAKLIKVLKETDQHVPKELEELVDDVFFRSKPRFSSRRNY